MAWLQLESFWLEGPALADELVRHSLLERLRSAAAVVGKQERVEVLFSLTSRGVVEGRHRYILDGAVRPPDLRVAPGMFGLGQPVLDLIVLGRNVAVCARQGKMLGMWTNRIPLTVVIV